MKNPYDLTPYQRQRAQLAYQRAVEAGDRDPLGFVAQLFQESKFNPRAVSSAGAMGEGQFMPGTAKRFGLNPFDPDASQHAALKYRQVIRNYNAKRGLVGEQYTLAGYNAGEGNSARALNGRGFAETKGYVASIERHKQALAPLLGLDAPIQDMSVVGPEQMSAAGMFAPTQPAPFQPAPPIQDVLGTTDGGRKLSPYDAIIKWRDDKIASTMRGLLFGG